MARTRESPLAFTPLLLRRRIRSPDFNFLSVTNCFCEGIMPTAEPPSSHLFGTTTSFMVGVSPPPQEAPESSPAFFQPRIRSFILFLSASHVLSSTAQ